MATRYLKSTTDAPVRCLRCGGEGLLRSEIDVPVLGRTPAGRTIRAVAAVGLLTCPRCGDSIEEPGSWVARDAAVHRAVGLLTATEILRARTGRGWSRRELADRTGIGPASIYRWERGQIVQSAANDRLLRMAFEMPLNATADAPPAARTSPMRRSRRRGSGRS